jgi:hypothetical protein
MPHDDIDVYEIVSWDGKTWDILYFDYYHQTKIKKAPVNYTFAEKVEGLTGINFSLSTFPIGIYEATQQCAEKMIGLPAANPKMRGLDTKSFKRSVAFEGEIRLIQEELAASIKFEPNQPDKKSISSNQGSKSGNKPLYDIPMDNISREFGACWNHAMEYIENQSQGRHYWLKGSLHPPFLEHFSFRFGNQLYYVRIEDKDGDLEIPGTLAGLLQIADKCKGYPCIMPMKRSAGKWIPSQSDWGLVHARTSHVICPTDLVSNSEIEMTDWELHDFAVQVVRDNLKGKEIMSWNSNPEVTPSLWFVGNTGPEWVVVKAARYPVGKVPYPENIRDIANNCSRIARKGYFAGVSFCNKENISAPLYRGHGFHIRYTGLEEVGI